MTEKKKTPNGVNKSSSGDLTAEKNSMQKWLQTAKSQNKPATPAKETAAKKVSPVKMKEEVESPAKKKKVAPSKENKKKKDDNSYPLQCPNCDKIFETKTKLSQHLKCHNERSIPCTVCDAKFANESNLKLHMKIHLNIKQYECEICKTRFTQSSHLKVHLRTHTKEKPYKCEYCQKAFAVSNALVVHRRIHTGERPYKCDVCDKAFMESGKLTVHKRTHSDAKDFKCGVCDAEFNQPSNLKAHVYRYHTEEGRAVKYECALCQKQFPDKAYLKVHIRYHTGEKNYECDQCNKKFTTKSELTLHMDYHKGVKNFKCEICGKEYFQQPHLKHHMKMHNSGKVQCQQCKRFYGKDSNFKHQCLPPARFLGKKTKKNIEKFQKLTGTSKVTAMDLIDEVTQSGLTDDEGEILEMAQVKAVKPKKGRGKKKTNKAAAGNSMVFLNMDIKEEAPEEEEEEETGLEDVLLESGVKPQKTFTYDSVQDEMDVDVDENVAYIFGSEEVLLMMPGSGDQEGTVVSGDSQTTLEPVNVVSDIQADSHTALTEQPVSIGLEIYDFKDY